MFLSLSHVVSWVRCGTLLYRILICTFLLTLYTLILSSYINQATKKYISSLAVKAIPYNSKLYLCYCKIIGKFIKLLLILTCQYNLLILNKWIAIWCYQSRSTCNYCYIRYFLLNTILKLKIVLYKFTLIVDYLWPINSHLSKIPTTHGWLKEWNLYLHYIQGNFVKFVFLSNVNSIFFLNA